MTRHGACAVGDGVKDRVGGSCVAVACAKAATSWVALVASVAPEGRPSRVGCGQGLETAMALQA